MTANHEGHLSQEVIHWKYPLENYSLFVVNIVNIVGFECGFPNVLIINTFAFILDWNRLDTTLKAPLPFSYYLLNMSN